MSRFVHFTVATPFGVASNNRGKSEGNHAILQKVSFDDEVWTTVSAEAIRFAIRQHLYGVYGPERVRSYYDPDISDVVKRSSEPNPDLYVDDDILGYMETLPKQGKEKGGCVTRLSPLAMSRAVSITPFAGDEIMGSRAGEKTTTSLFTQEVHYTSYVYHGTLDLHRVKGGREVAIEVLNGIINIPSVGGGHSRHSYSFAPQVAVFENTNSPVSSLGGGVRAFVSNGDAFSLRNPAEAPIGDSAAFYGPLGGIPDTALKVNRSTIGEYFNRVVTP